MRGFARLLMCDVRYGVAAISPRLVFVACIVAMAFFIAWVKVFIRLPEAAGDLSFGECMLLIWYGMMPYYPDNGDLFLFPMAWFCVLVAAAFTVADYPSRDLEGMGSTVVVVSGSRWAWWLSKCLWVVLMGLIVVGITMVFSLVVTLVCQGSLSLAVRPGVACVLEAGFNFEIQDASRLIQEGEAAAVASALPSLDIAPAIGVATLCLVAILLMQTVLSVHLHPVLGIAATIAVLFLSAYFFVPWLPGEYMLLARSGVLLDEGLNLDVGVLLGAGISVVAVVAGGLVFNRIDLVGKRGENR